MNPPKSCWSPPNSLEALACGRLVSFYRCLSRRDELVACWPKRNNKKVLQMTAKTGVIALVTAAFCVGALASPCSAQGTSPQAATSSEEIFYYIVDTRCGYGTARELHSIGRSMNIAADKDDTVTEVADSRKLIEAADVCINLLPSCAADVTAPCDDAPVIWVKMNKLWGLDGLAESFAATGNPSLRPLSTEVDSALDICDSPNITKQGQPYDSGRAMIKWTLAAAARTPRTVGGSPIEESADRLRACAQRIGDNEVSF